MVIRGTVVFILGLRLHFSDLEFIACSQHRFYNNLHCVCSDSVLCSFSKEKTLQQVYWLV